MKDGDTPWEVDLACLLAYLLSYPPGSGMWATLGRSDWPEVPCTMRWARKGLD